MVTKVLKLIDAASSRRWLMSHHLLPLYFLEYAGFLFGYNLEIGIGIKMVENKALL